MEDNYIEKKTDLLENRELRNQMSERVDVLDKVKELFLLPQLDMMTTQQVADYYQVEYDLINKCYQRNKDEIESDGAVRNTVKSMGLRIGQNVQTKQYRGYGEIKLSDDITLRVPNAGILLFPKRAVLRIGMLLRDSEVAKEVRSQLLNTFEHATEQDTSFATAEIDEEEKLLFEIVKKLNAHDLNGTLAAQSAYVEFSHRRIKEAEEKIKEEKQKNTELTEQNTELNESNKMLSADILAWTDRASVNKAIRVIACSINRNYGSIWAELYDELLYKHKINVRSRATKRNMSGLSTINESEWPLAQQSLCALCESHGLSPAKVFKKAKLLAA